MQPHPLRSRFPARRARTAWAAWLCVLALAALLALAGCQAGDNFTSEGTKSTPVSITVPTTSRQSTVGGSSSSYYMASPVADSTTYIISVTQLVADADLGVFTDASFTQTACAALGTGSGSLSCTYTVPSGSGVTTLYIQIKGTDSTGSDFLLSVQ
ncbi:MAG TPA: hypothetical protein VKB51_15830 [bacterium]|nr:hypothetical protein [bacterium]